MPSLAPPSLRIIASPAAMALCALASSEVVSAQAAFVCTVAQQSFVEPSGLMAGHPRPIDEVMPRSLRRIESALDAAAAADAEIPSDSLDALRSIFSEAATDLDLVGEEFMVHRSTGRIASGRLRNFGRGPTGVDWNGEPKVLDNPIGPYIAVTIRDEHNVGMGEVEYLRIDDDSHPGTFVFVSRWVGILTGTCGLPDGPYEEYYDNGQLYIRSGRLNGVQYGPWESYYRNGQLGRKGTLNEDGNWTGPYEEYDEDGNLVTKGSYESEGEGLPRPCGEWYMQFKADGVSTMYGSEGLALAPAVDTARNSVTYPPCRH